MYPQFYSIYSSLDRYHLENKFDIELVSSFKKVVEEINYDYENGRLDKQKYNEFHYVDYLNYIPIETLKEIIINQYYSYLKLFPFSNIKHYLEEYYDTFLFECEQLLKIIETGKVFWWDTKDNFDFYTYSTNPYDYCMVVWKSQTDNDLHFYELYLKFLIELLKNGIIEHFEKSENDNLQPIKPANVNDLKWNGTQTEFIELVKALIENGNIKGTQTETISKLSNVFNIKINNENKLINDIKTRNNGSETLFLDRLQKSLFDYITQEKKK